MEIKKSEKASLENKRLLFTEIGFVFALLVVLGAFSYTTKDQKVSLFEDETCLFEKSREKCMVMPTFSLMDIVTAEHVFQDDAGHVMWCFDMGKSIQVATTLFFALERRGVKVVTIE